jgi:thioester reductase-like protein
VNVLVFCGRFSGQINVTDLFSRLLLGIAYTGIVPKSFYTQPHTGEEHFDGMPVEFVAGVIAATAAAERSGFDTYHVVNPHWNDGVSLDKIADWVESAAGFSVSLHTACITSVVCRTRSGNCNGVLTECVLVTTAQAQHQSYTS